jgi:Fic family protein
MESEGVYVALHSEISETEELAYPLEDLQEVLAEEDAEDASDDPMHAGGLTPARWVSAEQAAMHVVESSGADSDRRLSDETDRERADPFRNQFDGTPDGLTPEDQTILGIDPYE